LLSKAKLTQELCHRVRQAADSSPLWALGRLANADNVSGAIKVLAGLVEARTPFRVQNPVIICTNQVLSFTEHSYQVVSEPFSPRYRKCYGSPFTYDPKAMAPEFIEKILGHLEEDDRILLQKYAGQVLIGRNLIQRFVILQGTIGGASKTVFIRTIAGVIGPQGCEN
jgi:phage/plasmid-associated DNA primase